MAILTMLGITSVALLCFLGFRRLGQSEAMTPPVHREFAAIMLPWRCEAGHTFRAPGQLGAGLCTKCGAAAYPTEPFECKQHGLFPVAAKFELDDAGEPRVAQFRLVGREWVAAGLGPACPKCGEIMERRPRDPLAGMERTKRKETRPPREASEADGGPTAP